MKAWKVILATLIIYLAGLASGALIVKQLEQRTRRPPPERTARSFPWSMRRADFLERLQRDLDLSQAQSNRIGQILRECHEGNKRLWESIEPQIREETKRLREKIVAELDPSQQERYLEMLKQRGAGHRDSSAWRGKNGPRRERPPDSPPQ